jgi:hypothetical protein
MCVTDHTDIGAQAVEMHFARQLRKATAPPVIARCRTDCRNADNDGEKPENDPPPTFPTHA